MALILMDFNTKSFFMLCVFCGAGFLKFGVAENFPN
jgi:hypothetical protein